MVSSPCLSPIGAKLTPYYNNKSVNGRMELVILSQPEEQHRARYLTEGSRGAIKDVTGMGHPVVKLNGYYSRQPIKLECYIGHDKHNGLPHLFYQASKISGKNSTQCTACKVEGTSVIVMNMLPENGMQATIDCVGILKERNVDVEQKLLNLNHSSKMIDFNELSYQQQQQQQQQHQPMQSAFTSISQQSASSQQQQLTPSPPQQLVTTTTPTTPPQLPTPTSNNNNTATNNNHCNHLLQPTQQHQQQQHHQQQQLHPFLSTNSNHLHHLMDENSISAMSRADSLEDSQDVSLHSHITSMSDTNQSMINGTGTILATPTANGIGSGATLTPAGVCPASQNGGGLITLNSRKRSVRCRLVFRVKIPETGEVLQTISTPIICTQPLGTPEICKKSLTRAPAQANNLELFIIGKNFLKDSKIVFRNKKSDWLRVVEPDKEFLNSSHLICKVPDYDGPELTNTCSDMIEVELQVRSGGKFSEAHSFVYYKTQPSIDSHPTALPPPPQIQQPQQLQQVQVQPQAPQQPQQQSPPSLGLQIKFEPDQSQQQQVPTISTTTQQQICEQQQRVLQQHQQQQQEQQLQQQLVLQCQQQQQQLQEQTAIQQQIQHQQQQQQQQQQQYQSEAPQQQQLFAEHQRQRQQQQIQTSQMMTSIDLHDDTTVVYADSLQQSQPTPTTMVHNVIQPNGTILSSTIDLNDETTVVYADSLQSQPTLVHNTVIQNGSILGNVTQCVDSIDQMNVHMPTTTQIQVLKQQQQQIQQQQYQQAFF